MFGLHHHVRDRFPATNVASTITLTPAGKSSRLYSSFSQQQLDDAQNLRITYNHHSFGIAVSTVSEWFMNDELEVLSTAVDTQGNTYVSSIEAKNYPFYGTQFHPEKVSFLWSPDVDVPHTTQAMSFNN